MIANLLHRLTTRRYIGRHRAPTFRVRRGLPAEAPMTEILAGSVT